LNAAELARGAATIAGERCDLSQESLIGKEDVEVRCDREMEVKMHEKATRAKDGEHQAVPWQV
jgi:hypothetical protein